MPGPDGGGPPGPDGGGPPGLPPDLDVFVANFVNGLPQTNQILTNDGDGNFGAADEPNGGARQSFSVALGDLDGDGGIPAVNEEGLPNLGDFLFA